MLRALTILESLGNLVPTPLASSYPGSPAHLWAFLKSLLGFVSWAPPVALACVILQTITET